MRPKNARRPHDCLISGETFSCTQTQRSEIREAMTQADNDEATLAATSGEAIEADRLSLREEVVGAIELITEQLEVSTTMAMR